MSTQIILWIYIALLLAGGLVGFLKAGSKASLIASSAFALPLVLCAAGVLRVPYLAEAVLIVLLLFFGTRFMKSKKLMPGGLMTAVTLLTLVLIVLSRSSHA